MNNDSVTNGQDFMIKLGITSLIATIGLCVFEMIENYEDLQYLRKHVVRVEHYQPCTNNGMDDAMDFECGVAAPGERQ